MGNPFFQLSFLCNIGRENVFYDVLKRKNTFLGYKKTGSKSLEIDTFPNTLSHGFGPKIGLFFQLFFSAI